MAKSNNYSILVDVELQTASAKKQLEEEFKKTKISVDTKESQASIEALGDAMEDTSLTFNVANEIFRQSIELIGSMVEEVYELDSALTEFKKVSDLSGASLNDYVDKLSTMGSEVARTASEMVESAT